MKGIKGLEGGERQKKEIIKPNNMLPCNPGGGDHCSTPTPTLTRTATPVSSSTPTPTATRTFTPSATYTSTPGFNPPSGEVWKFYYYAGSQKVAVRVVGDQPNANGLFYTLGDHLGSTSLIANAAGAKVAEARYMPWGETWYTSGYQPSDYLYTGQREEAGIGLYFYKARWYDPSLGRFTQADTIINNGNNPNSFDRYNYVYNNPLTNTDPNGHDPLDSAWEENFKKTHNGRNPTHEDRIAQLFCLAYSNECQGGVGIFYDDNGNLLLEKLSKTLHNPPESRSWKTLQDAMSRLAQNYEKNEISEFQRDVASLFGGIESRFENSSGLDAARQQVQHYDYYAWLKADGAPEDMINDDDNNVHHWAAMFYISSTYGYWAGVAAEYYLDLGVETIGRSDISKLDFQIEMDVTGQQDVRMGLWASSIGGNIFINTIVSNITGFFDWRDLSISWVNP